jgi:hypothetical protein
MVKMILALLGFSVAIAWVLEMISAPIAEILPAKLMEQKVTRLLVNGGVILAGFWLTALGFRFFKIKVPV